jgi:hypothetical protein
MKTLDHGDAEENFHEYAPDGYVYVGPGRYVPPPEDS